MARGKDTRVELSVAAHDAQALPVLQVNGEEALSEPFHFDVRVATSSGEPIDLASLLGKDATLTLRRPDGTRRDVHAIVMATELAELSERGPRYRFRLGPRLARLAHRVRSRIFQEKSALEIVAAVLDEAGVKHRSELAGSPPKREYTVQYRESDLAFVQRLLEAEGIAYRFDHQGGKDEVVLCDAPSAWVAISGDESVPYRAPTEAADEEHLWALSRSLTVVSDVAAVRDFHFEHPGTDLTARAEGGKRKLECYEYPAGHSDAAAGKRLARIRMEERAVASDTFGGSSDVVRLEPGSTFEVSGHPDAQLERRLVVVRLRHEARQGEAAGGSGGVERAYANHFAAVEASSSYRPPRRTARPRIVGLHTAEVVGPPGEEIHLDRHGRVKVQFHWDRQGRRDEHSSCWVRTVQSWAGPGFGTLFVPRIGQEVLVRFLEGDPDRPVVEGALYNGRNPVPVSLPADKTRSTLRSDSSPGGGGYNELRFEDAAGKEQIHVHAQKDEDISVLNDKRQVVRHDERLEVGHDRTQQVGHDHDLRVLGHDRARIAVNETLRVAGDREARVESTQQERVLLAQSVTVNGAQEVSARAASVVTVGAAAALNVGGAYAVNVGGALNIAVAGAFATEVGGAATEWVGGHREERVGGTLQRKVGDELDAMVRGSLAVSTGGAHEEKVGGKLDVLVDGRVALGGKKVTLEADSLAFIVGGKKLISIDKSGNVTLAVNGLDVKADGTVTIKGSKVDKKMTGATEGGAVNIQAKTRKAKERYWVDLHVVDEDFNPIVGEWYRLEFPDGTLVEGVTAAEGRARALGPKSGDCKLNLWRLDSTSWRKH